jgi:molybdopterin-guanine dinucleotide biosynthesis protein B
MILNVCGYSNTGKTGLVVKITEALTEKGCNVASVKHIKKENFSIDTEGKDTFRHSKAGAELVVAYAKGEAAFIVNEDLTSDRITDIVNYIARPDVILVEGAWDDDTPKIAIGDKEERPNTVFRYEDNFDEIMAYVLKELDIERILVKLSGLDCGKCGMENCKELARAIHEGKKKFDDCYYFSEQEVTIQVDGEDIPMGRFAKEIVTGTITGMISSLKGVGGGKNIKIEIKE